MKFSLEPTLKVENRKTLKKEANQHDFRALEEVFENVGINPNTGISMLNFYFSSDELEAIWEYLMKEIGEDINDRYDHEWYSESANSQPHRTSIQKSRKSRLSALEDVKASTSAKLGKRVKQLRGWKIYQGTDDYGYTVFRLFTPDDDHPMIGYEDWECDTLEEAISWVQNYDEPLDESKSVTEDIDMSPDNLLNKVNDNDLKNLVKSAGVKLSGSENKDELVGMAKVLATQNESFSRRIERVAKFESTKLKRKKGIPHIDKKEESKKKARSKFLK